MKQDKFDRAREIKSIQSYLEDLRLSLCIPHPKMVNKSGNDTICFIGLGEKYEKELRDLIVNFIKEKDNAFSRKIVMNMNVRIICRKVIDAILGKQAILI